MDPVQEKPHRLATHNYSGYSAVAFTCCIADRKLCFTENQAVRAIEKILLESLTRYRVAAHAYLFMPDHLHLLIQGEKRDANLYECIVHFKQRSGFWLTKNTYARWQKDFYDHVLRQGEEIEKHVRYILENPVRKNIVENWKTYPYKGSTLYDFSQW